MAKNDVSMTKDSHIQTQIMKLEKIDKNFGVTRALDGVGFGVVDGEVIGLIGPNGAGKSTLMKIITGDEPPTSGSIQIDNEDLSFETYNRKTAHSKGIVCVYQELSLCNNLSVYENFMITHRNHSEFKGINWRKKAKRFVKKALDDVFPDHGIDVSKTVEEHAFGQRQMIEIARAISIQDLRILILDEPTSSLTHDITEQLHEAIRDLKKKGISIIYVSHKLEEIKKICDRIVILKNGLNVGEVTSSEISTSDLVVLMGGQKMKGEQIKIKKTANPQGESVISVTDLTTKGLQKINMEVKSGEIVGLSGLGEAGQLDLLYELYSARNSRRNKSIDITGNVAFISGDRKNKGVFPLWSIADNILIASIDRLCKWGVINREKSNVLAKTWYDKLKFRANNPNENITSLSGGNQQKALIARGIASEADIILLDDPTRGVDIETKQEIYRLLQEAKSLGKTVVWHSTEDEEMTQCDRVYVMRGGAIIDELVGEEITVGEIVRVSFDKHEDSDSDQTINNLNEKTKRKKFTIKQSMLPFITLIGILIIDGVFNPNSISYLGFELLFSAALPLVFISLAQMVILQIGDIDLGIGQGMGLINVIIATIMVGNFGMGLLICLAFILSYAGMGLLIHVRKIPSIVVTLGASFVWKGVAVSLQETPGGTVPDWLRSSYEFPFPVVPMGLVICIVVGVIAYWFFKKSKYGVVLRGAGNNPESIIHAGWSHLKARVVLFTLAGVFVVLAGLAVTAISYGSDAYASDSYTMTSIAAVVLGGCEFSGGVSEPAGVIGGAVAISLISSLLMFMRLSTDYQSALVGIILILALVTRLLIKRRRII